MTYQVYPWINDPYPPYQFNFQYKNSTQLWSGPDNKINFLKNLNNPEKNQILKSLEWDTCEITYQYNSHGFRCEDFDNRPCGIALGCSFTHGIGLPITSTWPYLLSQLCGIHVWNLGSGGASIDTVFRIFDYYVTKLSPKFVCILTPPAERLEYCDINGGFPIINCNDFNNQDKYAKEWLGQPFNAEYNLRKTVLAIEAICHKLNIPLIVNHSSDILNKHYIDETKLLDLARDLLHNGIHYQTAHAHSMFEKIKELRL